MARLGSQKSSITTQWTSDSGVSASQHVHLGQRKEVAREAPAGMKGMFAHLLVAFI